MPDFDDPVFRDALFHQKRKHGKWRTVEGPVLEGPVADTHAHVQMQADPALALARAALHGVRFVANVCDICEDDEAAFAGADGWRTEAQAALRELAGPEPPAGCAVPDLRLIVGCHPHNAKDYDARAEARLRERVADARVCAVGEIGLDYHYDLSPRDVQRTVFRKQLLFADECGLPVSLHLREAHGDALAILREQGFPKAGTVVHCFNLGPEVLRPFLDAGCYIAIGGPVTFGNADELREAVKLVPLDLLLTETDSPYMAPVPLRGSVCEPAHTVFTAERLAEVRGVRPGGEREEFLAALYANALRVFGGGRS